MTAVQRIVTGLVVCMAVAPELRAQSAPVALYLAYVDESACNFYNRLACKTSLLLRATVDGPRSRIDWQRVVPSTDDVKQGYVTPDGRFVVWLAISRATGPHVYVHDIVSGDTTDVGVPTGAEMLLGNPVRPEVYVFDSGGVITLNPAGTRRVDLPCAPGLFGNPPDISRDGQRASVVIFCSVTVPYTTLVFDTVSGATVATVPGTGVVNADGTGLFTRGEFDSTRGQFLMQRRTLAGDVLVEAPSIGSLLVSDRVTGDAITWSRNTTSNNLAVLDGIGLGTTWVGSLAISGVENHSAPVFDPASGLAAAFSGGVDVVDVRAGARLGRVSLYASPTAAIMFGPPAPQPPITHAPVVAVGSVQLTWGPAGPPAAVTRYVLDAGSAPGLSDIVSGLDLGQQTSFGASGVPPGRYYVRVRAGNYTGLSEPSNEVVVQVPSTASP